MVTIGRGTSAHPVEIAFGGATVFVLDVARHERLQDCRDRGLMRPGRIVI